MWYEGFLGLSPWSLVAVTLLMTHVTIIGVTVYLHRYSAHRSLELNAGLKHFFRFWLWLTTAQNTREWTAIHRKHHAKCETVDDPHSPVIKGLSTVLRKGAELYRAEAENPETLRIYGKNCPDDWIERNVYTRFPLLGVAIMGVIDLLLFGTIGITIWADPDDVDPGVGRRRGQWPGPCHRLPQLRVPRCGDQPGALGHPDRW